MVRQGLLKSISINSFVFVFSILLMSFLAIGGCNNNNNNNNDDDGEFGATPPTTSACITMDSPCVAFNTLQNGAVIQCVLSQSAACAVDLSDVASQTAAHTGQQIDENTLMWIEAWGGEGGFTDKGSGGGDKGYAVTTSKISDIASNNSMSTTIYYFVGSNGRDGGDHCGSAGGSATIVTTEDLILKQNVDPTEGIMPQGPNILVAGGGGGGSAGNAVFGCSPPLLNASSCGENGGAGGVAINSDSDAGGDVNPCSEDEKPVACGGAENVGGAGTGDGVTGTNGVGGIGGAGGSGQDCSGPRGIGFLNTDATGTELNFAAGTGGSGGTNTGNCGAGGGGGGGGYGGGGGGSSAGSGGDTVCGGGGGSLAANFDLVSDLTPQTRQASPCGGAAGCVSISFELP